MKVILKQTVPKVGKEGQVVNVKNGYARNFLFPRSLAIVADDKQVAALGRRHAKIEQLLADTKAGAEQIKEKLHGQKVRIPGKVGKELGKLFGSITAQDVADAIKAQLGVSLEKRQVGIIEPIKRLGDHAVEIDLHRDVDAVVTVRVFDPENPEVEAEPVVAEAPAEEEAPEA
jgi:large subunit ribosomal protein L9